MPLRLTILLLLLATACAPTTDVVAVDDTPGPATSTAPPTAASPTSTSSASDDVGDEDVRIWFEVLGVSQEAPDIGVLELATTAEEVDAGWTRFGLDGDAPEVDPATTVVLFVGRAEDACPDELVAVERVEDRVSMAFVPPPGGCAQPLVPTGYAVQLHRAELGGDPTIALDQNDAFDADTELEVELPPYDGPAAPPPPELALQPSEEEVAALFADHPIRPCDDFADPLDERGEVDGPLSDDERVAEAQQARADMALPSDADLVTELLADPANLERGFDVPLTQEEFDQVMQRGQPAGQAAFGDYLDTHRDTYGFSYLSQVRGGVFVIGFTADLEERRAELAEQFPDLAIEVVDAATTEQERQAVVDALFADPGDLPLSSGAAGLERAELGLIDPTREDLDTLATRVDPELVCISPEFSGLPRP